MSNLIVTRVAAPSTPATDKSSVYVDTTSRRASQIDDRWVISELTNNGIKWFNVLHNWGFRVQQRQVPASTAIAGISTTTRAWQVADRWAVTSSVASNLNRQQVDVAGTPDTALSSRYYGSIISATAGKKVCLSQVILSSDMSHLRGKKVRFSLKHNQKVGSGQLFHMGIIQLTNAGTTDVLPAFLSGAFSTSAGVAPAWNTNLSVIAPDSTPTGQNGTVNGNYLDVTSVAATWTVSSAVWTIPTAAKNLVVVFWQDATGGTTDNISVAEAQLTMGTEIVDFVEPALTQDIMNCQRFFSKSFPYAILPAASVTVANGWYGSGWPLLIAGSGTLLACQIPITFPVRMWKVPAITYYTPTAAGAAIFRHTGTTPAVQWTTATVTSTLTDIWVTVQCTAEATANGAVGNWCSIHWSAEAEFIL